MTEELEKEEIQKICPIMSRPFPIGVQQGKNGLIGGQQAVVTLQPLICVREMCELWTVIKGVGMCAYKRQAFDLQFIADYTEHVRHAG